MGESIKVGTNKNINVPHYIIFLLVGAVFVLVESQLKEDKIDSPYSIGQVLLLSKLSITSKVLLVASVPKKSSFKTTTNAIDVCIEHIMKRIEKEQHIDTIRMPILGSGHGQVNKNLALRQMLISILHYHTTYGKLKTVEVFIYPDDRDKINSSFVKDYQKIGGIL